MNKTKNKKNIYKEKLILKKKIMIKIKNRHKFNNGMLIIYMDWQFHKHFQ